MLFRSWERIKRGWMSKPASAETLTAMFHHANKARVRLGSSTSLAQLGSVGQALVEAYRECEQSLLQQLQATHPDTFGRLHPPRRADGTCDLDQWMTVERCGDNRGQNVRVKWKRSDEPFGNALSEQAFDKDGVEFTFSAGQSADADVAFLNAPFFVTCPDNPTGKYYAPLHACAERVWQASKGKQIGRAHV
mgnify:FL=1